MGNWVIRASICYDMGSLRKNNEDSYYFNGQYPTLATMDSGTFLTSETNADGSMWAICDGMGGQNNGELASYTAVSGMRELQNHLRGRDFESVVQSWVHQANQAVNEQAGGGGSTLALIYFTDQYLQTAHVGDSRIYRYHKGELIRITKDHSKVEMLLDSKMITPEEALHHPQKNVVTRYLGMNSEYICDATIGKKIPLCNGDRYLICSDGITDMLTDPEIEQLVKDYENVSDCAEKIKEAVIKAGARDNLTVIVLEPYALDVLDVIPNEEEYYDDDEDDEPTIEEEGEGTVSIRKDGNQMNIRIRKPFKGELILHGPPSKVSLSFN